MEMNKSFIPKCPKLYQHVYGFFCFMFTYWADLVDHLLLLAVGGFSVKL